MRFRFLWILVLISVISLTVSSSSLSAPLTDEVVEKLRREGTLDEWINQWQSAAQGGNV